MDKEAPDNILEVTARAITYYLDVSVDCTRRITAVDGALKAIITRMKAANVRSRTSKDLAEQCVKVSAHESRIFALPFFSILVSCMKCRDASIVTHIFFVCHLICVVLLSLV